jgi:hypothetical protein
MAICPCGAEIPPQQGRQRPRKKCVTCSPPRNRPSTVPKIGLAAASEKTASARRSIAVATLADLTAVDRQDTTAGITALHLAELLDAGGYNAQGAASLVKAHRESLAVALEGTAPDADVIDAIFGSG